MTLPPGSHIRDGQKVLFGYFHTALIYEDQVMCCMAEPKVYEILRWQLAQVHKHIQPDGYFLQHDEIRVQGWDESCRRSGKTPGEQLAENVRKCAALVRKEDPGKPIYVWSDMFDPQHNAPEAGRYYLVKGNGPWYGSWKGLDKDVVIVNWNRTPPNGLNPSSILRASVTGRFWPGTTTVRWERSGAGSATAGRFRGSAGRCTRPGSISTATWKLLPLNWVSTAQCGREITVLGREALFHIITTIVLLSGHPGPLKAQDAPEGHDIAWQSVGPGGGGWIQSNAWTRTIRPCSMRALPATGPSWGKMRMSVAGQSKSSDHLNEDREISMKQHLVLLIGIAGGFRRRSYTGRARADRHGTPARQRRGTDKSGDGLGLPLLRQHTCPIWLEACSVRHVGRLAEPLGDLPPHPVVVHRPEEGRSPGRSSIRPPSDGLPRGSRSPSASR